MAKKTNYTPYIVAGLAGAAFLLFSKKASAAPLQVLPSAPGGLPDPGTGRPARPGGNPPPYGKACYPPKFGGSNAYNKGFWDAGSVAASRARIFEAFENLGYLTPGGRDTMNALGPDGELGGGDDFANPEVTRFQRDYNKVSNAGSFASGMGGLDVDGKVGPCTLNALATVSESIGDDSWDTIVRSA